MTARQSVTSLAEIAMPAAINGPPKQVFDPNAKKTHGVSGGTKIPGAKSPAQGRAFRNQQRLDQNL